MKKLGTVLTIVLFIAAVTLSFFVGDYMSDKPYKEDVLASQLKDILERCQ